MPAAYSPVGMRHGYFNIAKSLFVIEEKDVPVFSRNEIEHFLLGSGKSALLLSLSAMHETCKHKDEVIIPAYTCYSVAAAVKAAGLKIRLVDIDISNLNYLPEKLHMAMGRKTLAVVFTSFFALPIQRCLIDLVASNKSGRSYIIVDSAQSYFCDEDKYKADSYVFSLGRGKPLNAEGGGVLGVSDSRIKNIIHAKYSNLPLVGKIPSVKLAIKAVLNDLFLYPRLYWIPAHIKMLKLGVSIFPKEITLEKMSRSQKNLLYLMEEKLFEIKKHRQKRASVYNNHFKGKTQLVVPKRFFPARYPIYLDGGKIDEATEQSLKQYGVARMYPKDISNLDEVRGCCVNIRDGFSNSEWIARHLYTLPVHEYVTKHVQDSVIRLVSPYLI